MLKFKATPYCSILRFIFAFILTHENFVINVNDELKLVLLQVTE